MPTVETVRGPVDTASLGRTLMHEHVFVLSTEHVQNYGADAWWDEDERVDDAVAKLTELQELGIDTIVDPTVWGLGRYIPRVQRVAERVRLNIIVATGLYTYDEVPHQYEHRGPGLLLDTPRDPMVDDFTADITTGIAGTGVKAAFLKCVVEAKGLTPGVDRVLRAVAATHRETGAPITVHTHPGSHQGLAVQRVFEDEGVDPRRVVLGHSGDTTDADHLTELAEAGFVLGMDRFGINLDTTFEARADIVVEMCRRGFAGQMVLSQDASCYIDWLAPGVMDLLPQWHYTHIHEDVLPYLREHGVTDEQITTMLVDVSRRYFEGTA